MLLSKKLTFRFVEDNDPHKAIKVGIWLYIFLLIFEGALRKWLLPSLATPLLIIRDPLAIWLIFKAVSQRSFNPGKYWTIFILLGIISFFSALIFGHASMVVALYGARILFIHLPVIFIIGNYFNRTDTLKVGYVLLILLIPMVLLSILQFYSPQTHIVNKGVGGDLEGAGFGGALGFYRPPGTFSFINGLTCFYGITSSFLFYFLFTKTPISKWLLYGALLATILSIPFSISRTVLFQNVLCLVFTIPMILSDPRLVNKLIPAGFLILVLGFASSSQFVQTGLKVFTARFESASESEGGLKGTLI